METSGTLTPIDWRHSIAAKEFIVEQEGAWLSPRVKPPFPFDELIYSWDVRLTGNEAFRLYLKAVFGATDETEWLYAGFWGPVTDPATGREKPTFDRGFVDMDWLKMKAKAQAFQFRVVSAGATPLKRPPSLHVVATDNHPSRALAWKFAPKTPRRQKPGRVFDIPLRRQIDSKGERMEDRCQSAALASAMEYYGTPMPLETIVAYTHDPEYNYPGLWPRVVAAAGEFGFDGYIDRFREWNSVREALADGKVILCSIRMAEGDCKAPPYKSMGNHIVALNGVTDDGRVVVTDSALGKSGTGYMCQWLQEDFETIWMKTKGGVAMVICPPSDFEARVVENVPAFPADRMLPAGDDH